MCLLFSCYLLCNAGKLNCDIIRIDMFPHHINVCCYAWLHYSVHDFC